jgi:sec-independent protein translocase protein TatC
MGLCRARVVPARAATGHAAGGTASTLLFYAGAFFCYFFVFGQAFPAIQKMAPASVAVSPDIEAYLDFVITMFIAFGVAFEVPIVVMILARMGIVTVAQLKSFRSYFVVGAAAVAGLVTPPDPVSMLALLVPMCLLYEVGIWAAQIFIKHTQAPRRDALRSKLPAIPRDG